MLAVSNRERGIVHSIDHTGTRAGRHLACDHAISSHHTSQGAVSYRRCRCGDIVVSGPGLVHHVHASSSDDDTRPRTVAGYLRVLAVLADSDDWDPETRHLLHDAVSTLVEAAATEIGALSMLRPAPADPPISHLRTLARLAQRTAGRTVRVCPALADRLDELCADLARRISQ